MYAMKD